MKALVKYARGDGFIDVQEVRDPTLLPGHIIIEVKACGICGTDLHIQAGEYPVNPPVILGHEFSGVIAEIAPDCTVRKVGERVTSLVYFTTCGVCRFCVSGQWGLCQHRKSVGSGVNGAFAHYVMVHEKNARLLPDHIDFISGAMTEPLACCAHGVMEKAATHPGDVALVTGPGAIGLMTAQILVSAGVTVVMAGTQSDVNRMELARKLGVQYTLEVEKGGVPDFLNDITNGQGADWVFECSGAGPAAAIGFQTVRRGGVFVQLGLFGRPIQLNWDMAVLKEVEIRNSFASTWVSWDYALKLLANGRVQTKPLVSDILPITEWESAFSRFRNKDGIKFMLLPVD